MFKKINEASTAVFNLIKIGGIVVVGVVCYKVYTWSPWATVKDVASNSAQEIDAALDAGSQKTAELLALTKEKQAIIKYGTTEQAKEAVEALQKKAAEAEVAVDTLLERFKDK